MRRTFAETLRNSDIDINNEYSKLYGLFNDENSKDGKSFAEIIASNFIEFPFRGTCLTFDEFNRQNKFRFERSPRDCNVDYLINYAEYMYNLLFHLDKRFFFKDYSKETILNHINSVIEKVGYIETIDKDYHIFVPRDAAAISVAESKLIPDDVSYKVLAYNHSSKKGNIEEKKAILIKLAELLEPKEQKLKGINKTFSSDLFNLLNNCNIRHNNIDSSLPGKYHRYIEEMPLEELEKTYDEIYQMCLFAFMQLEQADRNAWVDDLKDKIVSVR